MEWLELVFSQELYSVADQHTRRLSRNSACVYTHVSFTRVDQKIETRHEVLRLKVKLSEIFSYIAFVLFANVNFRHVRT